eukprot:scpid13031/ scgid21839/ 
MFWTTRPGARVLVLLVLRAIIASTFIVVRGASGNYSQLDAVCPSATPSFRSSLQRIIKESLTDLEERRWTNLDKAFLHSGIADRAACLSLLAGSSVRGVTASTWISQGLSRAMQAVSSTALLNARIERHAQQYMYNTTSDSSWVVATAQQLLADVVADQDTAQSDVLWHSVNCTDIMNGLHPYEGNCSEANLETYIGARHCFGRYVYILNRTVSNYLAACDLACCVLRPTGTKGNGLAMADSDHPGLYCAVYPTGCSTGSASERVAQQVWTLPSITDCDMMLASSNHTAANCSQCDGACLLMLACQLRHAAALRKLLHYLGSLTLAERTLDRFRSSLMTLLQPKSNQSWSLRQEISLSVCSAAFGQNTSISEVIEPDSTLIPSDVVVKVCSNQCYNTFQLLTALSAVYPAAFKGMSMESDTLAFLQRTFLAQCLQSKSDICSPGEETLKSLMVHSQCVLTSLPRVTIAGCYVGNATGQDGSLWNNSIVHNVHPHCTSSSHLDIACQYPFVPISSTGVQADEMAWLAGRLTEAACKALNWSNCSPPETLLHCGIICEAVWYSGSLQGGTVFIMVFAFCCFISTTIALAAFAFNRHQIKSPARRAIVYMNIGFIPYLFDYFLAPFKDTAVIVNGACTGDNAIALREPVGASACGFSGFRRVFASVLIISAGACSFYGWRSVVVRLTTARMMSKDKEEERISNIHFVFSMSIASAMAIIATAAQRMQGKPPWYYCLPDEQITFYTITIPYIALTCFAMVVAITSFPRIKRLLKSRQRLLRPRHRSRTRRQTSTRPRREAGSQSTHALYQLFKLLTAYAVAVAVHALIVVGFRTTAFVSSFTNKHALLDSDGIRNHSMCLMTSNISQTCPEIQKKSPVLEFIFHSYNLFLMLFFTAWAYRWLYWKDVYPFSRLYGQRRRLGLLRRIGLLGLVEVVRLRRQAQGSPAQLGIAAPS